MIDLIGYRRFGHNEMDEPSATQPMLYDAVRKHPTVKNIFAEKLIHNGIVDNETVDKIGDAVMKRLEEAYRKVPAKKEDMTHEIVLPEPVSNGFPDVDTSVDVETLRKINQELVSWPENFNVFDKLKRILERRAKAFDDDRKVDWSLAEAMALHPFERRHTSKADRAGFRTRHIRTPQPCPSRQQDRGRIHRTASPCRYESVICGSQQPAF